MLFLAMSFIALICALIAIAVVGYKTRTISPLGMLLCATGIIILTIFNVGLSYVALEQAYDTYQRESACVAKKVSLGIERRDIATANGTCYVKG